ncbi:unnamed protein product, partial [Lota lota]
PMDRLEDRMCKKHDRLLELFCQIEQVCVSLCCTVTHHKSHLVVPLKEEYEVKTAQLGKIESEVQQMIQERQRKIKEIKDTVELSNKDADRESDGVQVFTALKRSIEKWQDEFNQTVKERLKSTEKEAEGLMKELEQEIEDLTNIISEYEVDVTLDPDTAHPKLILSEDGKQVHDGDVVKNLPDNPKRFTRYLFVLAKQSFSSGRFYFEVQVKDKTAWVLGVARESINRKDVIGLTPKNGSWTLFLDNNRMIFSDNPAVHLPLRAELQKVGVFVDYGEGLVSFYDVEARVHIYSATGFTFSEPLYPFLCPEFRYAGKNSAPLTISPVNQTD